jgi:putative phosphoribosyl transferase
MAGGNRNRPLGQRNDRPKVEVSIAPLGPPGTLVHPACGQGVVLFAHGSGSSRLSPRNRLVAERLQRSGLGTLLFDLLQPEEAANRANVFDISLLVERLALPTDWIRAPGAAGCAHRLLRRQHRRRCRSGCGDPDPAPDRRHRVPRPPSGSGRYRSPAGPSGDDHGVIELNEEALARLACEKQLAIVPGAGHLFEEPGTLDQVVSLARDWFVPRLRHGGPNHASG